MQVCACVCACACACTCADTSEGEGCGEGGGDGEGKGEGELGVEGEGEGTKKNLKNRTKGFKKDVGLWTCLWTASNSPTRQLVRSWGFVWRVLLSKSVSVRPPQ